MELKKYKLADIGKVITGKTPSTSVAENYACGTIPFYTPEDVAKGLGMMGRNNRFITQTGFEEIASNTITGESVLVGCIGSDMGNVAYSNITCATNQQINSITQFINGVEPLYVYYLLSTMKPYFQKIAGSTTTPILPKSVFEEIEIHLPDIKIQKDVVSILYALDRKIELNKQINDNLEAMAKQLYDYWFVQFDFPNEEGKPYKSSGGAMVWNEKLKRKIPKAWYADNICKIANILSGGTPSKAVDDYWNNGTIPFFGPTDYNGNVFQIKTTDHITQKGLEHCASSLFEEGIVIITARGSIGKLVIVGKPMAMNQSCYALQSKEGEYEYLYFLTTQLIDCLKAKGSGSVFKSIIASDIEHSTLCIATENVVSDFCKKVKPLFEKLKTNIIEITELTKQRDELLPLLMNGQATVNYHLSVLFLSSLILYRDQYKFYNMKETIIQAVLDGMRAVLTENQLELLTDVTRKALSECEITPKATEEEQRNKENAELLGAFISSKKVEGCSDKTIHYYKSSIEKLIATVKKNVCDIGTNDIRCYLADQQEQRGLSKVTIDNLRRIYSSFFSWLEDEDYITKSPVRRIHKVRTDALVKEVLTDENIEVLRDSCQELRDIAMIDLLLSTGMRVGELVKINREDIDFQERQCVVFGKGNKEREVYFNARTKIHLKKYLEQRTDTNPALFVSLHEPHTRLTISGVEVRLRQLGKRVNLNKVHPHKFRRTLATMAIDKGMPIEQVQKMLGHVKIDTTLHYAMVNQTNVKIAHRKFLN